MSGDETFLNRWSRLKQERRDEPKPAAENDPVQEAKAVPGPGAKSPATAEAGDPEVIAKLPPLESLGEHSDYSPFMRQGVPQSLRLAALRKLWLSDPALAGPDVLDLHNLDYTHLAAPGQVVTTSYQVGRGFADKVDEAIDRVGEERAKEEAAAAKPGEPAAPTAEAKVADATESAPVERDDKPKQPV